MQIALAADPEEAANIAFHLEHINRMRATPEYQAELERHKKESVDFEDKRLDGDINIISVIEANIVVLGKMIQAAPAGMFPSLVTMVLQLLHNGGDHPIVMDSQGDGTVHNSGDFAADVSAVLRKIRH